MKATALSYSSRGVNEVFLPRQLRSQRSERLARRGSARRVLHVQDQGPSSCLALNGYPPWGQAPPIDTVAAVVAMWSKHLVTTDTSWYTDNGILPRQRRRTILQT